VLVLDSVEAVVVAVVEVEVEVQAVRKSIEWEKLWCPPLVTVVLCSLATSSQVPLVYANQCDSASPIFPDYPQRIE